MKFNKGDVVILDKEKVSMILINRLEPEKGMLPNWYSNDIFTIIEFRDNEENVAILNKNLKNSKNEIHTNYLKLLKDERKEKLLKINSI